MLVWNFAWCSSVNAIGKQKGKLLAPFVFILISFFSIHISIPSNRKLFRLTIMPKSSTPASKARKHHLKRLKAIENISPAILFQSIQSKCVQTESIVMSTKTTNTPNYFHDMLEYGKKMTDEQFERFLKGIREKIVLFCDEQTSWAMDRTERTNWCKQNWSDLFAFQNVRRIDWTHSHRHSHFRLISFLFTSFPIHWLINILDRASDCYWRILAERARLQLEEKLRENRQVKSLRSHSLFRSRSHFIELATWIIRWIDEGKWTIKR